MTVLAGLPPGKRGHRNARIDATGQKHLLTARRRWAEGRHLPRQEFARVMFGAQPDGRGVRNFHDATLSLAEATRPQHLRDATDAFAAGMLDVGLDLFPRFLAKAAERAGQEDTALLIPAQARRGGGGGLVRTPGGQIIEATPGQEIWLFRYNTARRRLYQLEPSNPYTTSLGPLNTMPSRGIVLRMEQEVRDAESRVQAAMLPPPGSVPPLAGTGSSGFFAFQQSPSAPDVFGLRSEPGQVPWAVIPPIKGPWLTPYMPHGAPVPGQVAERLMGRTFPSFNAFREAFWEAVADVPELDAQFSREDDRLMQAGRPPMAPPADRLPGRIGYELNHDFQIRWNGAIYDLKNLVVMTPRDHVNLHRSRR